tara:strand:+ start:2588 stop:3298 length:711 start_codon:yes stop_codon:yes gene_type:complete
MASERAIEQALRTLAQNYVNQKYQADWVEGAIALWIYTFSDEKAEVPVPDSYLINGVAEFCKRAQGDFPPNLNKFYSFLQKEYRLSTQMHASTELDACDECDKGKRMVALHMKQWSEARGEEIVLEKFYHVSCDCPAGKHEESRGLNNWRNMWEKQGKNDKVLYACMTNAFCPDLPPEAMVSEWRRAQSGRGQNVYSSAVKGLEQGMIARDKRKLARGEKPVDRMEFINAHREDYY